MIHSLPAEAPAAPGRCSPPPPYDDNVDVYERKPAYPSTVVAPAGSAPAYTAKWRPTPLKPSVVTNTRKTKIGYGRAKVVEYAAAGGRRSASNEAAWWVQGLGGVGSMFGVAANALRGWLSVLFIREARRSKRQARALLGSDREAARAIGAAMRSKAQVKERWAWARMGGAACANVGDGTNAARFVFRVAVSSTALAVGTVFGLVGDAVSSLKSFHDVVNCTKRARKCGRVLRRATAMRKELRQALQTLKLAKVKGGTPARVAALQAKRAKLVQAKRFLDATLKATGQHRRRQWVEAAIHVVKLVGRCLTMAFALIVLCGGPVSWVLFVVGAGLYVASQLSHLRLARARHRNIGLSKRLFDHEQMDSLRNMLQAEAAMTKADRKRADAEHDLSARLFTRMLRTLGADPRQVLADPSENHWVLRQALLPS